jgi:O-antigen/teichoic acid export membrane protein
MDKALKMGKASATGSFQLLVGVATSTVVMAVGTIILARLLAPDDYGLYTVALIPATMINMFRDWGVNSAMTKFIANLRGANKESEICDVILAGVTFECATGLVLSLFSFLLAGFFASVLQRPVSTSFISIVSITILGGSLFAAAQSSFIGFERMELSSFTVICQSILKTAVGPLLVILGFGVLGAVVGYTVSFLAEGIIGIAILYFVVYRRLKKAKARRRELSRTLKEMLRFGVPLSISSILGGVLGQFYGFMMASYANNSTIGNYQAALNFSVLLTFFTGPIGTVLFPAFAKLNPEKEHELLRTVFASSVKYTAILLVPATFAVMALSTPMVSTLFGEQYAYAPFLLTLNVIGNLFTLVGNLSVGTFLLGLGQTKMMMKMSILTLTIGIPTGFLMISRLGVVGVILGNILSGVPSMVWALYWIWKHYKARADFKFSAKILAISALAAATTYSSLILVNAAEWVKLLIGGSVFFVVYIFTAPLIRAISRSDIRNLKAVLSGLSVISGLIDVPLDLADRILTFSSAHSPSKHLRESKIKQSQNELLKDNYDSETKKLVVFLTPGSDVVNGGILSITSIYEETKKLKGVHEAETVLCTIPGDPLLLKYTQFENQNHIFNFALILSFFQKMQSLIIHIPEYCIDQFLKSISKRDYTRLNMKDVHINIMLQNIEMLSPMESIERIRKLGKLTCTTAHEKYSTLEMSRKLGMPLHKLSTFVSPEKYCKKEYAEKENLMVVSPDEHPRKAEVLRLIAEQLPNLRIQIINNLTYEEYKEVVARAKWALTFGEGLDGYFVETIFSGGIAFSVYNSAFFTEDFKSLQTIYDDYDVLIKRICSDIRDLDNEQIYGDCQKQQYDLCKKYYDHREYVRNLECFYKGKYTFK